jgi:hypothetical protein
VKDAAKRNVETADATEDMPWLRGSASSPTVPRLCLLTSRHSRQDIALARPERGNKRSKDIPSRIVAPSGTTGTKRIGTARPEETCRREIRVVPTGTMLRLR